MVAPRAPQAALAGLLALTAALAGCLGPGQSLPEGVQQLLAPLPFVRDALAPAPLRFGAPVLVDDAYGATEPSVAVDPEGRIFVAAPAGLNPASGVLSGQFWRSTDGGASFEHLEGLGAAGLYGPSIGGGDSDIASDAQGNLYAIDLWLGNVGFLASQDHGDTWLQGTPVTFATPGTDRQWIDVDQVTGQVYVAVNSLSTGLFVARSDDGGLTFAQQTLAVPHADRGGCICPPGVLTIDESNGNVYLPYYRNPGGVGVAVSTDHGASFAALDVPGTDTAHLADSDAGEVGGAFVGSAHDSEGNVYLAWESVEAQGRRIVIQASSDQGQSWSPPVVVAPVGDGEQIFPWIVAGDPGKVAVGWYEQRGERWDARLGYSDRALDAAPVYAITTLSRDPVLHGAYDRGALGDFFELALDAQGRVHAVWNELTAGAEQPRIVHAVQVDGPVLLAGAPAQRVPEPAPLLPADPRVPPVRPSPPQDVAAAFAEEITKETEELPPP